MKLSSVSLKEHALEKGEVRKADGLAWYIVELVFWDNSQAPNSVSLRYYEKTIFIANCALLQDFLPGKMGRKALQNL